MMSNSKQPSNMRMNCVVCSNKERRINSSLMFGLIMMETCAVYALLVAILIIFILGGKI